MNRKELLVYVLIASAAVFTAGCATTVQRVAPEKKVDFSGRWNDTDAHLVAEEMIRDCTTQGWQPMFMGKNNRAPVVIVGEVKNQSSEHINTDIFSKELERSLINSGKVRFVANKFERPEVREEREQQQSGTTAPETIKKMGRETGADFMMIGSLNSVIDETGGKYAILYQVNLELIDMENNEKVWIGQKEIKKIVNKSKYSL